MRTNVSIALCALLLANPAWSAGPLYRAQIIDPVPGTIRSEPGGLNDVGQVTGWSIPAVSSRTYAYAWTPGHGTIPIETPPGYVQVTGLSINNHGIVLGESCKWQSADLCTTEPFTWTRAQGFRPKQLDLESKYGFQTLRQITDGNEVLGNAYQAIGAGELLSRPFLASAGKLGIIKIDGVPLIDAWVEKINAAGQMVASVVRRDCNSNAVRYDRRTGALETLGVIGRPGHQPCGVSSTGRSINDHGDVVGDAAQADGGPQTGFFWSDATGMIAMDAPGKAFNLRATDVNNLRQVVGTYLLRNGASKFFYWDFENQVVTPLSELLDRSDPVTANVELDGRGTPRINAAGQILVSGGVVEGNQHLGRALLLTPVRE